MMADVKGFGAVGDGVADDSDAIQHAVDQGDGSLELPGGAYRLSRPIVIELRRTGPFSLTGGGGRARLLMAGPGPALRVVGTHDKSADPEFFREGVWARERMPTVASIEVVGQHDQADGIELEGTMQATLGGVSIRRCRYGVHLVKRNRNVIIADSHIYHGRGAAIGVYFDGVNLHQTNIVGCHISYCKHAGIKIARSEIRNLQITGCDIEYNFDPANPDSADVWIDSRLGTVREGTISSCTIQAKYSPNGSNIRIEGPELDDSRGAGLWAITGNILQSQAVALRLINCRGIAATGNSFAQCFDRSIAIDHCRNVLIGSSTFDRNPDYTGQVVDGITVRRSVGISLTGLILDDSRAGTPELGAAIEVFDTREVNITGCQLLDPLHRGIELKNVRHARVTDCTVVDRRETPTMMDAIRLIGESQDNIVSNNLVSRGRASDLTITPGTATASGNVISERPGR
jgi:hypothetical protein